MTFWRVLFSRRAWADATEIGWERYVQSEDVAAGQALIERLYAEARKRLEMFPGRQPVLERESALLGLEVRRLRIAQWHAYYHISEGDDGPVATVLFFWYASRQPVDEGESTRIMADL